MKPALLQAAQRAKAQRDLEVVSDVDSEGHVPPTDTVYVDPTTIAIKPTTANAASRAVRIDFSTLPVSKPQPRPRYRELLSSKLHYEEWVEDHAGTAGIAQRRAAGGHVSRTEVQQLEEDSDFIYGRPYGWPAYCVPCKIQFAPHVPPLWGCPRCREKVWQPTKDPESKFCAVCRRSVGSMRVIGGKTVKSPFTLNPHYCKRCGRIVCDHCYNPQPVSLPELGYDTPQRMCETCVTDIKSFRQPPEEEDLGTLHDTGMAEVGLDADECMPFWLPKCGQCKATFPKPPPQWLCPKCNVPMWQPAQAVQSVHCWLCQAQFPKSRCHSCGQLSCATCGAYAQPLPQLGWTNGTAQSVCRACYGGQSVVSRSQVLKMKNIDAPPQREAVKPQCPQCHNSFNAIPEQWVAKCHRKKAWQARSNACVVCSAPIHSSSGVNCTKCGWLCCMACTQYKEPLPELGFPADRPQTICKACYDPSRGWFDVDHWDRPCWPPQCQRCRKQYDVPPPRWNCVNTCGMVWQPVAHICSRSCAVCGQGFAVGAGVNCRRCGRLVCAPCGAHRGDAVDRGFPKGMPVPLCTRCVA